MRSACSKGARPVVLTFVGYYLPGYKSGGPIRTIANIVATLGDEIDFRIVTSDRDAAESEPYAHLDGSDGWLEVGKAKVLYLAPTRRSLRNIGRIVRETPHDTLYLNSFFDPVFTLKPLLARRLGLAPKRRCVIASRAFGLHRDLVWQASSEHEEKDVRAVMGDVATDIRIAADLLAPMEAQTPPPHRPRAEGEPLRVVFLSRISPMKNLDFALEVLKQVRAPVSLDIYGPVREEAYWARCSALMAELPSHVTATYRGSVEHDRVHGILAGYDLFFLPTLGENFGHIILEALSAGTPVLISDATPWRDLAALGVGWDISLQAAGAFADRIDRIAQSSAKERMEMRKRALAFAQSRQTDVVTVEANRSLLKVVAST